SIIDRWRRARAFVEAEIVLVMGRIIGDPEARAGLGVQAFDSFLVVDAVEEDRLAIGDDRAAEALADVFLPEDLGASGREGFDQIGSRIASIAGGPEELGPIRGESIRGEEEADQEKSVD